MSHQSVHKHRISIDDHLAVNGVGGAPRRAVEWLSPTTARVDRHEKYWCSITLPSLDADVRVAQDQPLVEMHRRSKGRRVEDCNVRSAHQVCLHRFRQLPDGRFSNEHSSL